MQCVAYKGKGCQGSSSSHSKALTVESIVKFARKYWDNHDYLPKITHKYPNRVWVRTVGKFGAIS